MAKARLREQWRPIATLTALYANVHRDSKKRPKPFAAEDFNPFATPVRKRKPAVPKAGIEVLKALLNEPRRK